MTAEFCYPMRVEFADTDMAGIVHFAQFFRYMEIAEHAFWRALGLSVHAELDGRMIGWPRGRVQCEYKTPLRFEDEFVVRLRVREQRRAALTFEFQFLTNDDQLIAVGTMTTICTEFDPVAETMRAVTIPKQIADKLNSYGADSGDVDATAAVDGDA